MTRILTLVFLLVLSGCQTMDLDERWAPLTQIKQSLTLSPSATGARTIGDTIYVRDIGKWLAAHPEPLLEAILLHEHVHSVRQHAYPGGVWAWIAKYVTNTSFMWSEEQLGWYEQILYARNHGATIVVDKMAKALARYRNASGHMVSEADAEAWIRQVLNGQWRPSE